jgi:hypothetical protein
VALAQAPHRTLGKNLEKEIHAQYQRGASNQIQWSDPWIKYLEHNLEQYITHTEACFLGYLKWRTLHVLERLLAATTALNLHRISQPPLSTNAIKGHSTRKGPLEGKLSAIPLVQMENWTPWITPTGGNGLAGLEGLCKSVENPHQGRTKHPQMGPFPNR